MVLCNENYLLVRRSIFAKVGEISEKLKKKGQRMNIIENSVTITPYTVTVDYGQSIEEMVWAGRYDDYNKSIIDWQNYSIKGEGKKQVEVFEVCFGREMESSEEVCVELDKLGYKPAEFAEFLALGKERPELQRDHPILAIGSPSVICGDRCALSLDKFRAGRGLYLRQLRGGYGSAERILAVRK